MLLVIVAWPKFQVIGVTVITNKSSLPKNWFLAEKIFYAVLNFKVVCIELMCNDNRYINCNKINYQKSKKKALTLSYRDVLFPLIY